MQIVISLDNLSISKCGNYYNMPESINSDKIELVGINKDAEAYIYRSRLVIKKGSKSADKGASKGTDKRIDAMEQNIENIASAVGALAKAMSALQPQKGKVKA